MPLALAKALVRISDSKGEEKALRYATLIRSCNQWGVVPSIVLLTTKSLI